MIAKIALKHRIIGLYWLAILFGGAFVGLDIALYSGIFSISGGPKGRQPVSTSLTVQAAQLTADQFTKYMATDYYVQACRLTTNPPGCQAELDGSLHDTLISNITLASTQSTGSGYTFTYIGVESGHNVKWSVTIALVNDLTKVTGIG